MATLYSDRNIRGRIQDFEKQLNTNESLSPLPRPRNITRPNVAPKPNVPLRPSDSSTTEEETNTQMFPDEQDFSTENTSVPSSVIPRPQVPKRVSLNSNDRFNGQPLIRAPPQLPSRASLHRPNALNPLNEDSAFSSPPLSSTSRAPHNSHCSTRENEYVELPTHRVLSDNGTSFTNTVSRKPTIIKVPSKQEQEVSDCFPARPVQKAASSFRHKESFSSTGDLVLPPRPGGGKVLPSRSPSIKPSPGCPLPPRKDSVQRNSSLQSNKLRQDTVKKPPVLPPRPKPGHWLYNKYTLEIPHGIAQHDYNGTHTGELSFQKNEVLVLLEQSDSQTFECQVGDAKGSVHTSYMKVITPLSSSNYNSVSQQQNSSRQTLTDSAQNGTLQVQALYDFTPEGPGELGLKAGDVLNNVEQIDSEWYLASNNGLTGFFPINYVKILHIQSAAAHKPAPASPKISGPRCLARFDFEGEHSDELSFSEGQVFRLLEYTGEEWARGEIGGHVGIFPLNFVEVLEDLPPSPSKNQTRVPLPGMAAANNMRTAASAQNQACTVERVKALYDFTAESDGDLAFLRGDVIQVLEHIDGEWSQGRLDGREGLFPISFTQAYRC